MEIRTKYFERVACIVLVIASIILVVWDYKHPIIDNGILVNVAYGVLLFYIIGYHIFYCEFKKDTLRIGRIKAKNYKEISGIKEQHDCKNDKSKPIKRVGNEIVFLVFGIYLASLVFCSYFFRSKAVFFIAFIVSVLMLLDNIFKYEFCIIHLFTCETVKCCSDCHLAAWDDILIFSALIFVPVISNEINIIIKILIVLLVIYALIRSLCWDWTMELYPERFKKKYNKYLSCPGCQIGLDPSSSAIDSKKCNQKCDKPKSILTYINESAFLKKTLKRCKEIINHNYIIVSISGALFTLLIAYYLMGKVYFFENYIFCIIIYFEIPLWIAIYKWVEKSYKKVFEADLKPVFYSENNSVYNSCFEKNKSAIRIFKMYTYKNLFIFVCVNIILNLIILYLYHDNKIIGTDILEKNIFKLYFLYILTVILIAITSKAIVILYNSFRELKFFATKMTVQQDYYIKGYKHYIGLKNFCTKMIMVITIVGVSLFVCVLECPVGYIRGDDGSVMNLLDCLQNGNIQGIYFILITIVFVIAAIPTIISLIVYYYLGMIKRKMKEKNSLEKIESSLEYAFKRTMNYKKVYEAMELRAYMVEKRIGEKRDYSLLSWIGTVFTCVVQILIILNDLI